MVEVVDRDELEGTRTDLSDKLREGTRLEVLGEERVAPGPDDPMCLVQREPPLLGRELPAMQPVGEHDHVERPLAERERRRASDDATSPRGTGAPSRWRRRSARAGRARAAVAAPRGSPSATGPPQIGPAGDARAALSAVPCCSRCPAVLRDWGRGAAQPGRRSDDGGSRPHAGCNRRAPRAGASPRTPWRGPPLAVALKRLRQEPEGERLICEHIAQTHLARHPLDVGLHEVEILRVAQPHGVQALGFGLTHVPGRRLGVGIGVFVMIAQRLPVLVPGALYGGPDVVARERHRIRYRPSTAGMSCSLTVRLNAGTSVSTIAFSRSRYPCSSATSWSNTWYA